MLYNSKEQVEVIRKDLRRRGCEVVVGVENKKKWCLGYFEFKAPFGSSCGNIKCRADTSGKSVKNVNKPKCLPGFQTHDLISGIAFHTKLQTQPTFYIYLHHQALSICLFFHSVNITELLQYVRHRFKSEDAANMRETRFLFSCTLSSTGR